MSTQENPATINQHKNEAGKLVGWLRSDVKLFLESVQAEKVAPLEADARNLENVANAVDQELVICFLGNAGVGKSTLINSLVAGKEIILPAGGIGPLTAQALVVRHSSQRRFEVEYHISKNLWKLAFALETVLRRDPRHNKAGEETPDDLEKVLDAEDRADVNENAASDEPQLKGKIEELKKQAQLLVTGNQDSVTELTYIVDTLREITGNKRVFGTHLRPEDETRVQQIRSVLELANEKVAIRTFSATDGNFLTALRDHASGFLAPLIKELRVFWDSPVLQDGVAFVDLPGVGISGDVFQATTNEWIRKRARAIILVVETRGITSASAELLRTSGFLNNLLYFGDDPNADPPILMVAVVKGDTIAEERFAQDRSRKKREHFADVCNDSIHQIRNQLRIELERAWASDSVNVKLAQKEVIDKILATLEVHAVSAVQYRKLLEGDEEDRAFITDEEQSRIPQFIESLRELARRRHEALTIRLREVGDDFFQRVLTTIRVNQARWRAENRASEEAEHLRSELDTFLEPIRREFDNRRGAFREFLRVTLPVQIQHLVGEARTVSSREIEKYLKTFDTAHFATLRAAVRRGGTFHGARMINLPIDFALRFEEPIAEVWAKSILKEIRTRTHEFARDCVAFVDQVVEWAKKQGAKVQTELVLAQREEIKADAKRLEAVGREMVKELRDQVKNSLVKKVEGPIRRKCQKFVDDNADKGTGVKLRILGLFRQLADDATEAASGPAIDILTACFREVEKEILAVFEQHSDPLNSAADAIVASHELRMKRSDAQRRKKVLAEAQAVLSTCPWQVPDETAGAGGEA